MTSPVTLDDQVFWTPPVAAMRQTKQRQSRQQRPLQSSMQLQRSSTSMSLRENSVSGAEADSSCQPNSRGRSLNGSIKIPSDTKFQPGDVVDPKSAERNGHDVRSIEHSQLVVTRPSSNTIIQTIADVQSSDTNSAGCPSALSPLLAQLPSAPSLPQAEEALQGLVSSILPQLGYPPESTTPSQLQFIEAPEHHALQQLPSLGISAGQDLETGIYEDHSARTVSQHPTNPLLGAEMLDFLESSNQGGSSPTQDDCGISSITQQCKPDVYHIHNDQVASAHIDMPKCLSPANGRKKFSKEDDQASDTNEAIQKSSRKRRKRIQVPADSKRRRSSRIMSSQSTSANLATQKRKCTSARSMSNPLASHKLSKDRSGKMSTAIFKE